jgi:hypothetical protein
MVVSRIAHGWEHAVTIVIDPKADMVTMTRCARSAPQGSRGPGLLRATVPVPQQDGRAADQRDRLPEDAG